MEASASESAANRCKPSLSETILQCKGLQHALRLLADASVRAPIKINL